MTLDAGVDAAQAGEIVALANLLHLSRRARQATDAAELAYVAMNESNLLAPYRQAVLWLDGHVEALSGVVAPEANAPYVQWVSRLIEATLRGTQARKPQRIEAENLPADVGMEWDEWLPEFALWLPLPELGEEFSRGGWLLARDNPWSDGELEWLQEWTETWSQAWVVLHRPGLEDQLRHWRRQFLSWLPDRTSGQRMVQLLRRPRAWRGALLDAWARPPFRWVLAAIVTCLLPVRLTVLAPGELVPAHPVVVRAPVDGVIERIHVAPNQVVQADTVLFEFDRASLASRLAVSEQALATASAEYRQFAQEALSDDKMKAKLVASLGAMEERKAEAAFLREMHERAVVKAPQPGMVIFDDPTEWNGRPVVTGEKIMLVAAPDDVEIEAWLSLADAIDLANGANVTLYLNTRPFSPISGELRYLAHEAQLRPDGHYAYRLRATIPASHGRARSGLKGTAKVNGSWVPMSYWVLRKPLAALRNLVGL